MNRVHAVRRRNRVLAAAVGIAAGAFIASSAARADFPFPPTPRELHHDVRALVHDVLRTLDRIPVEIHGAHAGNLEPFFVANTYYGPHRHYHAAYSFPVWIDGSVTYRPYAYCNSRLYGSYGVRPQFWSGWGVASHGRWCGHHHAYYPTAHACFRPQARSHYGSHYGSQNGSHYRSEYRAQRSYGGSHHDSRSRGHGRNGEHHRHDRNCHHGNGHDRH